MVTVCKILYFAFNYTCCQVFSQAEFIKPTACSYIWIKSKFFLVWVMLSPNIFWLKIIQNISQFVYWWIIFEIVWLLSRSMSVTQLKSPPRISCESAGWNSEIESFSFSKNCFRSLNFWGPEGLSSFVPFSTKNLPFSSCEVLFTSKCVSFLKRIAIELDLSLPAE